MMDVLDPADWLTASIWLFVILMGMMAIAWWLTHGQAPKSTRRRG